MTWAEKPSSDRLPERAAPGIFSLRNGAPEGDKSEGWSLQIAPGLAEGARDGRQDRAELVALIRRARALLGDPQLAAR